MYLHALANLILAQHPDVMRFEIGNWRKQDSLADVGIAFVNRRINRAVQNNHPLQRLIDILAYKARLRGQATKSFDERGTTRTCCHCDHVHEGGIDPARRSFECERCGFSFPRDHHSCLNFAKRFEPALWQRLAAHKPASSTRSVLTPFTCEPRVVVRRLRPAS